MSLALISFLTLSALWPGKATDAGQPYPGFNDLDLGLTSSCVSWGQPLRGGPIKTLFIAPRFTLRDAVELSQRLQIDVATVPLWDAYHVGMPPVDGSPLPPGTSSNETLRRLAQGLDGRDVILAGNFDFAVLPDDHWTAILNKVRNGKGLILAVYGHESMPAVLEEALSEMEPADGSPILRGIGESLSPEWARGLGFVSTGRLGKGRVVQLNYAGERPHSHFLAPPISRPLAAEAEFFDVYMSLVAKATVWAAGRDISFWVTGVEAAGPPAPTDAEIPPIFPDEYVEQMRDSTVRQPYNPYNVLFNKPSDGTYDIQVQVRQPGRDRLAMYSRPLQLKKGDQTYPIALDLGTGKHYVDVWLLDKGRVVDWHTTVVEVNGWPTFENLRISKDTVLPNDTLDVSLNIPPPLSEQIYEQRGMGCGVMLRAVDSLKRVVASSVRHIPPSGGHVEMSLTFADLLARRLKIEVFVLETPPFLVNETREFTETELGRAAYACRHVAVKSPTFGTDFLFVCSPAATAEYNVRDSMKRLALAGVDVLNAEGEWSGYYAGEANLHFLPRLTGYHPSAGEEYKEMPCLTDPAFLRGEGLDLERAVRTPWIKDSPIYSLGSGNRLVKDEGHFCRSATCLAGFRGRLSADYGSLDALNVGWGSTLSSMDTAMPLSREEANASGRFAPWVDFRQYMDTVFTSIHTFARDLVKVQEPRARTGFTEAADSDLYAGYDWHQLASELDMLITRSRVLSMEKVRSYRRPGMFTGLVYDHHRGDGASYITWLPWAALSMGMPSLWFDGPSSGSTQATVDGMLAPDGRLTPPFSDVMAEVGEIKRGLGKILLDAQREPAAIAIYDGAASAYLCAADPTFGDVLQAQTALATCLGDLGYEFDFISPAQLVAGGLKAFKVVFLPLARALSDGEVQAVRTFAENGGCVVADIAPGEFTEHGVRRSAPPLGDLFGVRWDGIPRFTEAGAANFDSIQRSLSSTLSDGAVTAADSEALGLAGDTPVWFMKKGAAGFTVLTNLATPTNTSLSGDDVTTWRLLYRDVLSAAGVSPLIDAKGENAAILSGRVSAFRYGRARIIVLLRDPNRGGEVERIEVPFAPKDVVYDLRTGERVSRPRKHTLRLARGAAAVFAVMPYDVAAMELEVMPTALPGKRLPIRIALHSKGGLIGDHVVRLDFGPYPGGPLAHYGQNAVCKEGRLDTYIPLGYREKRGLYRVTAYDVLSGTFAEAMVKVDVDEPDFDPQPGKRGNR